jgi:hypothetical protein
MQSLTISEQQTLNGLEATIEGGLEAFYRVGNALLSIRDGRLYRANHATFEDYCRERWNISRPQAYRLLDAAGVAENLSPIGDKPTAESQARELATLNDQPELQRQVWQAVVASAANAEVTAALVKAFVDKTLQSGSVPHVARNSGDNEWYTPNDYIDAARQVMGEIDLDPASSHLANQAVKATEYYTIDDDGLKARWRGKVWLNPPYATDLIGRFTGKLSEHYLVGDVSEAVVLVNNATETGWFQKMAEQASALCFPKSRVRFLDPSGNPSGAPLQGQAVLYFGDNVEQFKRAFSAFGFVR